jgi:pilus assembly protein Flp/PilA
MLELIRNIAKCQRGATAVEYGLIAALIVIAMIAAFNNVAGSTTNMWNTVSNQVLKASK